MRRFVAAVGMVFATLVASACVEKGNVSEKSAFTGSLASYRSASVEVTVPNSVTNSAQVKSQMSDAVTTRLREKNLFADVPMSGGELTVRVNVNSVDSGNKGLQAMGGGGDAELAASVELYDTKESKVVGAFDVTGNSKQNYSASVSGVNTKAISDTTATACGAAADQIADYLDKHRGSGAAASGDDVSATFSAGGQTDSAKTGNSAPPPAPVADTPPAPSASACPLVCMVANIGRAAAADEQRLSGELSGVLSALRLCGNGQNSLTMRFDSGATLTEFGVDAERGNEGACVEAIRQERPAVTYQGPATLRCAERCSNPTTTSRPRRRAR